MSRLLRALHQLSQSGFPWSMRRSTWSRVARHALREKWPPFLRPIAAIAMTLLWPVVSLHQSITMARAARQGPRHLWARAWAAALLRNVPPWEFADYQFFRPGTPQTGWRFTRETAAALTSMTDRDTAFLIADKARFAEWLDEQGIPAVPTLTIFEDGNSLVTKPPHGSQGQGVQAWIACDGGFRAHAGFGPGKGPTLTIAELEAHIARNNLIAQPLIASPLGQAAIRVVTYREETPAQVFDSLIQVAAPSDFCTHRGPFRRINAASGQVLPPGPGQIRSIFAPDLGEVASEGQSVPGWTQIIDGLLRAHDSLTPPIPLIGWDILIGPDGPLVLEGNTGIGLHLFQLDRLEPANVPMAERLS